MNLRALLPGWKLVNFDQGTTVADPNRSDAWNRGARLVNHLGHCGACHTPKLLGAVFLSFRFLAGSEAIPGPYPAANITPDPATGLGRWSEADIVRALGRAITPAGEPTRGPMAEHVAGGSSHLTAQDLAAMAIDLRSIEPDQGPVSAREERHDRRLSRPTRPPMAAPEGGICYGFRPSSGARRNSNSQVQRWRVKQLHPQTHSTVWKLLLSRFGPPACSGNESVFVALLPNSVN